MGSPETRNSRRLPEVQKPPLEPMNRVPISTGIILRDHSLNQYVIREVSAIRDELFRYDALSYNFKSGAFEFRKIVRYRDEGVTDAYRIRLRNGYEFKSTLDGKLFFFRQTASKKRGVRRVLELGSLGYIRSRMRLARNPSFAVAKKIPEIRSIWKSEDLLWLEGFYVAEGCATGKNETSFSNSNLKKIGRVKSTLFEMGIPFKTYRNKSRCYDVRARSVFTSELSKRFGARSFEKTIPDEYLSLSAEHATVFLDGYAAGDGHVPQNGQLVKTARVVYDTCSWELTRKLMLIHLLVGRPLYRQEAAVMEGGWGKRKMYRLIDYKREAINSRGKERMPGVMDITVASIRKGSRDKVCSIMVFGNHNFVTDLGIILPSQ